MEPQAPSAPEAPAPQPSTPESQGSNGPAPVEHAPAAPTPEVQSGSSEGSNQGPGVQLPPVMPQQDQPTPAAPAQTPADDDAGVVVNAPPIADDVDVIEKEWVDKAKQIVNKTKDDPRQQNKEVNALKADYLKKRYNKDIKVSDK